MWNLIKPQPRTLRAWQLGLLVALIGFWYAMTTPGLLPNFMFENDRQAAFFFGEPVHVAERIWAWFVTDADIYQHLGVTLTETVLAFAIGALGGLGGGLWLALSPMASAILARHWSECFCFVLPPSKALHPRHPRVYPCSW